MYINSISSRFVQLAKMGESSFFGRVDCLNALDRNDGNLEQALLELEVKALEPIRKRVLPVHDLEDSGARRTGGLDQTYKEIVNNKNVSFEVNIFQFMFLKFTVLFVFISHDLPFS
jgi:hypothetical protein